MTNLYEFRDLSKQASASNLPSEALTFGGINIDKELAGYRTLNVSGRENFTRTLNTASSTADGELFISSKLDTNEITIKYLLNADTVDDFNQKFIKLKNLLQGEEKPFFFADETQYIRYGTVTSLSIENAGVLSTTGAIVIKMSDPYRYSSSKSASGASTITVSDTELMYQQGIDTLTLTVGTATNTLVMTIDSYKMTLNGSFPVDTVLKIDFVNKTIMNGVASVLNTIDITKTDIFEAKIKNGSVMSCANAKAISMTYRDKIL